MNLLYNSWSITSPAQDTTTAATQDPARVHFTNRHFAYAPLRIHPHQISVKPVSKPYRPIQLGNPTKYWNPEIVSIHIWVLPNPKLTIEAAYADLFAMENEVKRIIRILGETVGSNIQHILLGAWQDRSTLEKDPPQLHVDARATCQIFEMSLS